VRRADAGETIIDTIDFSQTPETDEDDSIEEKISALAEIICCAGDEPAAALFVLMERWSTRLSPSCSRTRRSTFLLHAVVSRTCMEWSTLRLL
jgi:hypothetical protein